MARKRDTGDGTPYTPDEEAEVEAALDDAFDEWDEEGEPTGADVEAQIEWAGTIDNNGRDGVRRTHLDGLDPDKVREVRQAVEEARRQSERPSLRSYDAKGWHAQLAAITSVARGPEAAAKAGLAPTQRTLLAWLSEERAPSKANQERIARAYDELRNPGRSAAEKAQGEATAKLTEAIRDQYGVTVRFRDIRSWKWLE